MKKENKVISLELAKELQEAIKEAGLELPESEWWWFRDKDGYFIGRIQNHKLPSRGLKEPFNENIKAFDTTELGEMLPEDKKYRPAYYTKKSGGDWGIYCYDCDEDGCEEIIRGMYAKTEAECRGKMLLYLIKNKLIKEL